MPRSPSAPGRPHADALAVLDNVAVHTAGMTRTVREIAGRGRAAPPPAELTRAYADFLRHTAYAVRLYGQTRFAPSRRDDCAARRLREAVGELHRTLDEFRRRLPQE